MRRRAASLDGPGRLISRRRLCCLLSAGASRLSRLARERAAGLVSRVISSYGPPGQHETLVLRISRQTSQRDVQQSQTVQILSRLNATITAT